MLSFIPSMDEPIPEPSFGSKYQCGYNETEINDKKLGFGQGSIIIYRVISAVGIILNIVFLISSFFQVFGKEQKKRQNFINGKIIYCFIWYRNMYFIHLVDEYNFF